MYAVPLRQRIRTQTLLARAARQRRSLAPVERAPGDLVELVVECEGDVAQLRADGVVINRLWDGRSWRIDITDLSPAVDLTLPVAPISAHSMIDLDMSVRARVDTAGRLGFVIRVDRVVSSRWTTTSRGGRD